MTIEAELHDGRVLEFPDGTSPVIVQATVKRVLLGAAGKSVPDAAAPMQKEAPAGWESGADSLSRSIVGGGEAALTLASGATAGLAGRLGGTLGGIAGSIASGKYGTQEGAGGAAQAAEEGAQSLTYQPRTESGRNALESISRLFDASKLAGLGPAEALAARPIADSAKTARQVVGPAVRAEAGSARDAVASGARRVFAKDIPDEALPSSMVGVGSAETDAAAMRRASAAELPIPIKLTKGQAERSFEQQQFEREAAKNAKIGEPLRQRFADQNEKILQNFDAWLDQTGAEAGSLRATGQVVTDALVNKSNNAKNQIRAAYAKARESGDMQEKIDAAPLRGYLEEHQAEAINATVLQSVEAKLSHIAGKDGAVSINDLEEIRKMVGRLSGKDATNATFGKDVKQLIDRMTDGKGGEEYKNARALRFRYGQEFDDHAVVSKLLSFKPGTKDRSVAYEDVFSHSILGGSLDDVRTVRKTLQTAGPEGQKAWQELQGATIQHIKDEITKNVQIDQAGNRVISPARLDKLVTELDKDGKLDFIFGKQGADQIRNVNGLAKHVFTAPPGAVNSSNTASILTALLDKAAAKTTGIPFLGAVTGFASKEVKDAKARKQVQNALE